MLEQYLPRPPKRILDIGCGYAHISDMFQKKYGTELYLLDGDISGNAEHAVSYTHLTLPTICSV